ncbi:hypothetical protein [Streptomyces sp. SH5]|uniref:hypothetical protein n=1 Tax=Streptomyces sp. SH5 TaxID=3041765 RepID=UPI0024781B04|nr:hypothetical protein [Streptomyces sp. SH5]WGP08714.1 hypothetical protein QFA72_03030 [Streptomyces sp. SH5]
MVSPTGPKSADNTTALVEEIRQVADEAQVVVAAGAGSDDASSNLASAWQRYRALAERQAAAATSLSVQVEALRAEQEELTAAAAQRAEEAAALQERSAALDSRTELLDRRDRDLSDREQAAEAAFTERHLEAGRELEAWLTEQRRTAVAALDTERQDRQARWSVEQRRLADTQAALDQRESELAQRERDLRSARLQLEDEREDVAHVKAALKEQQVTRAERFEHEVTSRTGQLLQQMEESRHRIAVLTEGHGRLSVRLNEYDGALASLGGMTLEQVVERLTELRAENARLLEENAAAPQADALLLEQLRQQVKRLAADNEELVRERGELESALQRDRIAVNERQNYLEQNNWLRAANDQLQHLLNEEAAKLRATAQVGKEGQAFPACSYMDREFGTPRPFDTRTPAMPELVPQLQAVIRQQAGLSYRQSDLRLVLAGMAMSRLHLFQGISGIGKTGLARALAIAFGSDSSAAVVPVQAGWRDPQDLMGYYNSFDRIFYESEFTKALYRAQCPAFKDRPFFIVLDEMNLSHPEQYFSGVLSALAIKDRPSLALTTAPVRNPADLIIDGTHIAVPDNVWFIGTANHDETTVGFADKTYDRAFVLELPWQHPDVPETAPAFPEPLGHQGLTQSFDRAQATYGVQADGIIEFLNTHWRDRLAEELRIGWGNRLERQIKQFAPVVVAAGGSPGEALDHLLATRILRSVRGRYDIHSDTLDTLRTDLVESLRRFDGAHEPTTTRRLLDDELRSRGRL